MDEQRDGPAAVIDANEISLAGVAFPTRGPIRYANISVVPNPVILGDVSRASDTQIMSQLVLPDASEGLGVNRGDARLDQKRAWTSDAETRYTNQITLPNRITDLGRPTGETAPPVWIGEYLGKVWVVFGPRVYSLVGTTWTLEHTCPAVPTSVVVFQQRLWITTLENGMDWLESPNADPGLGIGFLPSTWYHVNENGASLMYVTGEYMFRWCDRIYVAGPPAGYVRNLYWLLRSSKTPFQADAEPAGIPNPWAPVVQSGLQIDVFGIVPYVNSGISGTYFVGVDGVYFNTNTGLMRLQVTYGPLEPGRFGRSACLFKNDLIIPTGELGLLAYRVGTTDTRRIGLDQGDGVPRERWGVINQVEVGGNYLYALVTQEGINATVPRDLMVYAWDGAHWHTVASTASGLMVTPGVLVQGYVLSALTDGLYIGYTRADGTPNIKRIDERARAVSPRLVGTDPAQTRFNYAEGPVDHITPWYDLGSPIQQKLLTRLELMCSGLSATETVTVSYALDLDDAHWTSLDPITTDGLATVRLNGAIGLVAKFVRFKYTLRRQVGDSNDYKRPLIEFAVLHWARLLPAQYGFSAEIDLTKRWKGRTPTQLAREIERLSDPERTPQLIPFTYEEDLGGERRTRWVKVSRMTGTSESGRKLVAQGSVFLSLMAPYADDNV